MDIRKAFKSRSLFVVTTILLVFAATSFALKTTEDPHKGLIGTWQGPRVAQ